MVEQAPAPAEEAAPAAAENADTAAPAADGACLSTDPEALAAAAEDFSGTDEQHAAATKLQAIQRGNNGREVVRLSSCATQGFDARPLCGPIMS